MQRSRARFWMVANVGQSKPLNAQSIIDVAYRSAPVGQESILSKLITVDYFQRQCALEFPGVSRRTADQHNSLYQGWNVVNTERVMFANG